MNVPRLSRPRARRAVPMACLIALAVAAAPAAAQGLYKIVAPDGTVTYIDRPVTAANARVEPVGRGASAAPSGPVLPAGLREVAARFPVVLYTVAGCAPCDRGRELLRTRGVPYEERLADPAVDREAWLRAVGSLDAPGLSVGAQMLRGFGAEEWQSTLDAAGYPRTSRLPANYPAPVAQPLVARAPVAAPEPTETPASPLPQPTMPLPSGGGIRF